MIADATTVAIGLSNAGPRQKENIRNLRRKLAAEEDLLRLKREEQADVETQIDNTARLMIANNCSM
ncbi:MAG: hypothetical protein COA84_05030 [Robiginitomaculum sp.]|nr:MAG: hypothetical protein COA84_05030 [Robiginitomaculum sp.]